MNNTVVGKEVDCNTKTYHLTTALSRQRQIYMIKIIWNMLHIYNNESLSKRAMTSLLIQYILVNFDLRQIKDQTIQIYST